MTKTDGRRLEVDGARDLFCFSQNTHLRFIFEQIFRSAKWLPSIAEMNDRGRCCRQFSMKSGNVFFFFPFHSHVCVSAKAPSELSLRCCDAYSIRYLYLLLLLLGPPLVISFVAATIQEMLVHILHARLAIVTLMCEWN